MAVSRSKTAAKKPATRKAPVKKKAPVVEELIVVDDNETEDVPVFDSVEEQPVVQEENIAVKHEYDDSLGKFTAENNSGEKLEMFVPTVLPSEYCIIVRKFLSVNNGVSIGKYSVGTHKTVDYGELEQIKDGSLESIHCYNIVSERNVDVLKKAISKLKLGGKCFIVDSNIDLTKVIPEIEKIGVRFCGYGYRLFNHKYWFEHKNMSIAFVTKG